MTGDFNVAVVAFRHVAADGSVTESTESRELSVDIYRRIDEELSVFREAEGYAFEVRGPDDTGSVRGATRAERAAAAQELAVSIAADVIVYGTLTDGAVAPEFFIQARVENLADAEELTGQYELGSRIFGSELGTGTITDNAAVRLALLARTRALTQFVIGLSFYGGHDYISARGAFESADTAVVAGRRWQGDPVPVPRELGRKARRARGGRCRLPAGPDAEPGARERSLAAPRSSSSRRRSSDMTATAHQVTSTSQGSPGRRPATIERSPPATRPAVSNIDAKASYGLGRVYSCEALAGTAASAAAARSAFAEVVDEYEAGNEAIGELAAESYAGLALLADVTAEATNVDAAVCVTPWRCTTRRSGSRRSTSVASRLSEPGASAWRRARLRRHHGVVAD